jgi:hypothetical protein
MTKAEELLNKLGVKSYTKRHLNIINEFLLYNEFDCRKLLDQLGRWDANDLKIAEAWREDIN